MEKLEVVSPLGLEVMRVATSSGRLDSLDGKRVGEVWNGVFKGDVTFPIIRKWLQSRHPGITVVPYTEFPHAPGNDNPREQRERARQVADRARELGCDALISGNGA